MTEDNPRNSFDFDKFEDRAIALERLKERAQFGMETFIPLLLKYGLKQEMSFLDLGTGPGIRALATAKFLAGGSVVGIDNSRILLEEARRLQDLEGVVNLRFETMDVCNLRFDDDLFDFAYARLLLQHLPDPVAMLRGVLRVLKPGGVLLIEDIDRGLNLFYPEPQEWTSIHREIELAQEALGGDPHVGRKLGQHLAQAGFEEVTLDMQSMVTRNEGVERFIQNLGPSLISMLPAGRIAAGNHALDKIARLARETPIFQFHSRFFGCGSKAILTYGT